MVVKSMLLSRGSRVRVHALTAPWPSKGSQRSSRRFTSKRPASFCAVLVTMVCVAAGAARRRCRLGSLGAAPAAVRPYATDEEPAGARAHQAGVEGERGVHAGIGAGDAGDGERNRAQAAEVLAGVVVLEEDFVEGDGALPVSRRVSELQRIGQRQGEVLGDFQFAAVLGEVLRLHAAQIEEQALAGRQAFVLAVPVAELDEWSSAAELVLVGVLRLHREGVGELVGLGVDGR